VAISCHGYRVNSAQEYPRTLRIPEKDKHFAGRARKSLVTVFECSWMSNPDRCHPNASRNRLTPLPATQARLATPTAA